MVEMKKKGVGGRKMSGKMVGVVRHYGLHKDNEK